MIGQQAGGDPRQEPGAPEETFLDQGQPTVGRRGPDLGPAIAVVGMVGLAAVLFFMLESGRSKRAEAALTAGTAPAQPTTPAPLPTPPPPTPAPMPAAPPPPAPPAVILSAPAPVAAIDWSQRRRAPSVVVDLAPQAATAIPASAPGLAPAPALAPAAAQPAAARADTADDLLRLTGAGAPDRAVATSIGDLSAVIPQGAMIPAVLETAINSDLPGYTRAVVSRDVRSFDGKAVLIPRGSRLIGQYRSAVSLGQSRAFVIWTRVIRPDGVSVQIGSPGADALGQGGLTGTVDRHFFTRFGGSILLSVLNGVVAAVSRTPATQISIGSPAAAASAAATATTSSDIPPTVKVPQGEAIRIFVARDLDFSSVR